jgi:hypothetical protein
MNDDDLLEQMNELNQWQRLDFYECLAHELTVAARDVWSSEDDDAEMIDELKWLNEIQHRVVAKIAILRKNQHEWTESDSYSDFQHWISQNERNRQRVTDSIRRALRIVQSHCDV